MVVKALELPDFRLRNRYVAPLVGLGIAFRVQIVSLSILGQERHSFWAQDVCAVDAGGWPAWAAADANTSTLSETARILGLRGVPDNKTETKPKSKHFLGFMQPEKTAKSHGTRQ
jgi:hypothetical protein